MTEPTPEERAHAAAEHVARTVFVPAEPRTLTRTDGLPPFPTAALPSALSAFVADLALEMQIPEAMAAGFVLGCLAAIVGGDVAIQPPGWSSTELLNLFVAIVSAPGTLKSPTLAACAEPVYALERELQAAKREVVIRAEAAREVAKDRAGDARHAAKNAKSDDERKTAQATYETEKAALDALPVVVAPRIVMGDTTTEKLTLTMAEQGGSISVLADEDSLFANALGRYAKPGRAPENVEHILSAYSGKRVTVDRLGRASFVIERPCLTWCVPVQPTLFEHLRGAEQLAGRGFFDRWIFVMARDLTGQRDWEAPRVPATVRQRYVSTILEIGREVRRTRELHGAGFVIGVSADAAALHRTWARKWERSLGASGERHGIKGWGSKAYGLVWRLSGLLHLVRHGAHGSVDVATLDAAITLVSHFAEHQLAAVDELGLEPRMRAARELAAWIVDRGALEMTAREAKRALSVPSKGHVNAAIKLLMENGYVNESPAKEGPGRKSERYFVNPAALHSGSFGRRSRGVSGEVGREVPPKTALEDVSKSPKPPPDWTGTEAAEVAL